MTKQEVLNYLDNVLHPIVSPDNWNVYSELHDMIEELPSAEPARHGKWIPHEDEDGEHYGDMCSECGEWYVMPYGKAKFCPNCGARMDAK